MDTSSSVTGEATADDPFPAADGVSAPTFETDPAGVHNLEAFDSGYELNSEPNLSTAAAETAGAEVHSEGGGAEEATIGDQSPGIVTPSDESSHESGDHLDFQPSPHALRRLSDWGADVDPVQAENSLVGAGISENVTSSAVSPPTGQENLASPIAAHPDRERADSDSGVVSGQAEGVSQGVEIRDTAMLFEASAPEVKEDTLEFPTAAHAVDEHSVRDATVELEQLEKVATGVGKPETVVLSAAPAREEEQDSELPITAQAMPVLSDCKQKPPNIAAAPLGNEAPGPLGLRVSPSDTQANSPGRTAIVCHKPAADDHTSTLIRKTPGADCPQGRSHVPMPDDTSVVGHALLPERWAREVSSPSPSVTDLPTLHGWPAVSSDPGVPVLPPISALEKPEKATHVFGDIIEPESHLYNSGDESREGEEGVCTGNLTAGSGALQTVADCTAGRDPPVGDARCLPPGSTSSKECPRVPSGGSLVSKPPWGRAEDSSWPVAETAQTTTESAMEPRNVSETVHSPCPRNTTADTWKSVTGPPNAFPASTPASATTGSPQRRSMTSGTAAARSASDRRPEAAAEGDNSIADIRLSAIYDGAGNELKPVKEKLRMFEDINKQRSLEFSRSFSSFASLKRRDSIQRVPSHQDTSPRRSASPSQAAIQEKEEQIRKLRSALKFREETISDLQSLMEKKEDQLSHLLLENNSLLQDLQEKISEDNQRVPAPTLGSSSGVAAAWLAQEARNIQTSQPATARRSSKSPDRSRSQSFSSPVSDAGVAPQELDQTMVPGSQPDSLSVSRTQTDPATPTEGRNVLRSGSASGIASLKAVDHQINNKETGGPDADKREDGTVHGGLVDRGRAAEECLKRCPSIKDKLKIFEDSRPKPRSEEQGKATTPRRPSRLPATPVGHSDCPEAATARRSNSLAQVQPNPVLMEREEEIRCLQGLLNHKDELIEMLRKDLSEKESKVVAVLAEKFSLSKDYMAYLAERRERQPEILRTGTIFSRPRGPTDDSADSSGKMQRLWSRQQGTRVGRKSTGDSVRSAGEEALICTKPSKSLFEGCSRQTSYADEPACLRHPPPYSSAPNKSMSQNVQRSDTMNTQSENESSRLFCFKARQGSQAVSRAAPDCLGPYNRSGSSNYTEQRPLPAQSGKDSAICSETDGGRASPVLMTGLSYETRKSTLTGAPRPSLPWRATKSLESPVEASGGAIAEAASRREGMSALLNGNDGSQETDDSGVLVTEEETVYMARTRSFEDTWKDTESNTPQQWPKHEWIDSYWEARPGTQETNSFSGKGGSVRNPGVSPRGNTSKDTSNRRESNHHRSRTSVERPSDKNQATALTAQDDNRTAIDGHGRNAFKQFSGSRLKAEVFFDTLMAQTRTRLDRHMGDSESTGLRSTELRQTLKAYGDVQQMAEEVRAIREENDLLRRAVTKNSHRMESIVGDLKKLSEEENVLEKRRRSGSQHLVRTPPKMPPAVRSRGFEPQSRKPNTFKEQGQVNAPDQTPEVVPGSEDPYASHTDTLMSRLSEAKKLLRTKESHIAALEQQVRHLTDRCMYFEDLNELVWRLIEDRMRNDDIMMDKTKRHYERALSKQLLRGDLA
ncbi:hypothetical protein CSUI_000811 [Cystoisospora suis]|uniref:Uncharacterized protein n=1 Tax=Cystoisospora suis TaxID=483139 RepID=A0A2C6LEM9_9APIC|nr:hypothetical protein CSUI_000811 [Cystoisospora suis]